MWVILTVKLLNSGTLLRSHKIKLPRKRLSLCLMKTASPSALPGCFLCLEIDSKAMWRSPRCARQRITIGSAKPVDDSTCLTKCRIGGAAHRTITRLRLMGRYQKRNFGTIRDTLSAFLLLDLIRGMPGEPCRSLVAAQEADAVIGRDCRCRCRRGIEPARVQQSSCPGLSPDQCTLVRGRCGEPMPSLSQLPF